MLGRTADLIRFWDAPEAKQAGLTAEQYLWLNCLERAEFLKISDLLPFRATVANVWTSELFLIANFYVVDTERLALTIPDSTAKNPVPYCGIDTCYSNSEWEWLSCLYARNSRPPVRVLPLLVGRLLARLRAITVHG